VVWKKKEETAFPQVTSAVCSQRRTKRPYDGFSLGVAR
jgi:hypothetical protein